MSKSLAHHTLGPKNAGHSSAAAHHFYCERGPPGRQPSSCFATARCDRLQLRSKSATCPCPPARVWFHGIHPVQPSWIRCICSPITQGRGCACPNTSVNSCRVTCSTQAKGDMLQVFASITSEIKHRNATMCIKFQNAKVKRLDHTVQRLAVEGLKKNKHRMYNFCPKSFKTLLKKKQPSSILYSHRQPSSKTKSIFNDNLQSRL
ncbi:hypothetical protein BCR44DRAFT_347425 [Catenaria anguillulae PL171]|uniref:Uncharacterized protein n=1 Tax=Catenaria anguillulae PL171 TaxID=765915 RepID=A0A1Y2H5I4_9FUNG|nr:hypothetical protein BCR44DRAFT_347425 [Catenaria anguillulae PL171]